MAERATSPLTDRNPKDHIVFSSVAGVKLFGGMPGAGGCDEGFRTKIVSRDNRGDGTFAEETPFPTLQFPSDHALVCAELELLRR